MIRGSITLYTRFFPILALTVVSLGQAQPHVPMKVPVENSARYRWLQKPVLETRILDDMEDLSNWSLKGTFGYGAPTEQPRGEMTLSTEQVREGHHSLCLRAKTKGDRPGPQMGRPFGSASVVRNFQGEDWSDFNRISCWVYPDLPGFHTVSLLVSLHNDGELKSPGPARLGLNFLLLENHTWNHIVWEIPDLPRDKVTGVLLQYRQQGNEPGATDTATFYFDQLELQRVVTDHYEGWDVAPGRLAYSHTGYPTGAPKRAIASDLTATQFRVISSRTGETVLTGSVSNVITKTGEYQVLDFSDLREPGEYILQAGDRATQPFPIDSDVWTETVWKSINYFYGQRCGCAVPGIHAVCHRDWLGVHGDQQIVINGGWHDAGDLCQGLANTTEAIYAMLSLAERLKSRSEHPALARRLMEEARWGLDYVLKNNFGGGHRVIWATHDFWTNGIIGDIDDVTAEARNDPMHNLLASAAEAIAYRLFREQDPFFARFCLESAQSDWRYALDRFDHRQKLEDGPIPTRDERRLDTAAAGLVASVGLLQATGDEQYAETAVQLARIVMSFQQRQYFMELDVPLAGFFWESPAGDYILHKHHLSFMQAPVLGLSRLCEALPNHPEWIRWYTSVVLYSEYQKYVSKFTAPYNMLPESIYRDDEYLRLPKGAQNRALGYVQATREDFREQVLNGFKLGPHHYLRAFPVWFTRRGNHGTLLRQNKALAVAGQLRGDLEVIRLAEKQLEWVVGGNPFAQSTMTGEGYDFVPHYTAMSGEIVGSLPVGIETLRNNDLPYWSVHNHMNPKETWVHPVTGWIWNVRDLGGPGFVTGNVNPGSTDPVRFKDDQTGEFIEVRARPYTNSFEVWLPQGSYEIFHEDCRSSLTVLPASVQEVDLRSHSLLEFAVSHSSLGGKQVEIRVTSKGTGEHQFTLRPDNVQFERVTQTAELKRSQATTLTWTGEIESENSPWVVVVVADDDVSRRREIVGLR